VNVARFIAPVHIILSLLRGEQNRRNAARVKRYWEIIADNLSKAGWSWGCVSAIDSQGRTIWIADAHRDDGKRFIMRADEKLTSSNMMRQIAPSHRTIRVQHELHRMITTTSINQIGVANCDFVGRREALHFHGHKHRP